MDVDNKTRDTDGVEGGLGVSRAESVLKMAPVNGLTKRVEGDSFDEFRLIGSSSFTHGFLVQSLRSNDVVFVQMHGNRPVKSVTDFDISDGKGFLSTVYKAIVHFADAVDGKDVYSTILKVPTLDGVKGSFAEVEPAMLEKILKAHVFECEFYNTVASSLKVPIAKVHLTLPWILNEKEGAVHMEDLSCKARTSEYDSLTVSQVMGIAKHLALMHKNTLTKKDFRGKYTDNQVLYTEMDKVIEGCIDPCMEFCGEHDALSQLLGKYRKFCSNAEYIRYANCQSWKDLGLEPVLVHGDMWGGNILWLTDAYGQPSSQVGAIVDWQAIHEGSIMTDLARVMVNCTDGDVRRRLEKDVFEFYLRELTGHFEADGMQCPVTLDQIKKAYHFMFLTQAVLMPWLTLFVGKTLKDSDADMVNAKTDKIALRARHVFQDVHRLAEGELKWVFDKYNC